MTRPQPSTVSWPEDFLAHRAGCGCPTAGSPDRYRLFFDPDGGQRAASECGRLSWRLPAVRPLDEGAAS
ncbi:hypothetical protein [Streptomyces sp. NPDC005969]|uniref:hypothetical protein n=1 Tax=Streptomyces sp. NPDC005969 TaxID=3156722 RepID=UPI0033D9BA9F